jgi:two-component system, chemotaxis family, sensor kinase CheA
MDEFEIEIKRDFLQEAIDLLEITEKSFLELEKDPTNTSLLDAIFRFAHNLKGTSRAVGFGQIAELTHVAENFLLCIKNGEVSVDYKVVSTLLDFNDKVREMIEGLLENMEAHFECADLVSTLEKMSKGEVITQLETKPLEVIPQELVAPESTDFIINEELLVEAMGLEAPKADTIQEMIIEEKLVVELQALPDKKAAAKKDTKKEDETLRVSLQRLEQLNDLIGELVILQALVESSLRKVGENKTSRSLGKLCKEIQDLSMSLRMVPVGPTFQKLTRVVRDTSKLLGKKVELSLIGEETEIDKTVIESLSDPLVHIIRNAIDHGVETPAERLSAKKSEIGAVEIMAFHEGNYLVIQITDDGKGIDGQNLIKKAKAKGIIPQNAQLTEQQGVELIFHPGFSTKDQVSEVSGRGVGMDVVKTNIEDLGGEVKVRSIVGTGSCFRLMLPLTLAIIEGMLIETGGQTFVIPKNQVQEINKLEKSQVTKLTGRLPYLTLRNEVLPLFFLDDDLGGKSIKPSEIAIIVQSGETAFAVGISDIIRQQQVVVKPSTKEMLGRSGIMGTTILGDGRPALIIDLMDLYAKRVKKVIASEKRAAS